MKFNVVIAGAGFAGLALAGKLKNTGLTVLLIDRTNHHLFQPLLYQVATASLSPGDIAVPIRNIFDDAPNISCIMGEISNVQRSSKQVVLTDGRVYEYDKLVIATGARHSYFGHPEWEQYAPGLKSLEDALRIRENMMLSLERAEITPDPSEKKRLLTFVIIGGGPTGAEMAGAIAEIVRKKELNEFRTFTRKDTRVILVEGGRILSAYSQSLAAKAEQSLKQLGVEIISGKHITDINEKGVALGPEFIPAATVVWAAGNNASPLLKTLNTNLDKQGRAVVSPDLSLPDDSDVFVAGDAASCTDEKLGTLPGTCPVAVQQGNYLAELFLAGTEKRYRKPFVFNDKGSMATIGRNKAIAVISGYEFSGLTAWLLWSFVHIFALIGFRNRVKVMAEWIFFYFTKRKGLRLITHQVKDMLQP